MPTDFLSVLHEFQERGIRYVLVGAALLEMGFTPHAPVDPRQFSDESVRDRWRLESGMLVLSFWDPENRRPTVDVVAQDLDDAERLAAMRGGPVS